MSIFSLVSQSLSEPELTEPERGNPSLVMAALKQTFAHRLLRELRAKAGAQTNALWSTPVAVGHIWQRRFYDFVVFTEKKRVEKLRYMHRNPVQRGLVLKPGAPGLAVFARPGSRRHHASQACMPVPRSTKSV
jgi:hypothetical protein